MEKDYPSKLNLNEAGVTIFISERADFKPKLFRRDKESYIIWIKGTIINIQTKYWHYYFLNTNTNTHKNCRCSSYSNTR
jgi:hypothetical protein